MDFLSFLVRCAGAFGMVVCLVFPKAQAQYQLQSLPRSLPYQGILEKNGRAVAETLSMVFRLYAERDDCINPVEPPIAPDWTTTRDVTVYGGRFAVLLGEESGVGDLPIPDALFRREAIYLSITVDGVRLTGCQAVRPVAYAHRSTGDVPVGTVIDWWPPNGDLVAPEGWQICNGSQITDPRSPLVGTNTPMLTGRFVMGIKTDGTEQIGTVGGSDNTAASGAHTHLWSTFISRFWRSHYSGGSPQDIMGWTNGLDNEGEGIYPLAVNSADDKEFYTANQPDHSHTFSPPHMKLLKIMRIY